MAFENLFIRTKKSIAGIELDAVLTEVHSNTVRLTKNPVELGADITDHAIIEPKRITLGVQVSDTPLGAAAFGKILDDVTGLFGTSTSGNVTRSNTAYNAMVQLMETREPLEIQTKLKLYTSMVIVDIKTTQDKNTSRVAAMVIALEEVIITESLLIKLDSDQLDGNTKIQATSPEKKGKVQSKPVDENTNKSIIKTVLDWVFGR